MWVCFWAACLCLQRRLVPIHSLVGLACAANIGSASTLIGNPQNMLIGSVMQWSFSCDMALGISWAWLKWAA